MTLMQDIKSTLDKLAELVAFMDDDGDLEDIEVVEMYDHIDAMEKIIKNKEA